MSFYPGQNTTVQTTITLACQSTATLHSNNAESGSGSNNSIAPITAYGQYRTNPSILARCSLVSPLSNMGHGLLNNRNLTLQALYLDASGDRPAVFIYDFASSIMMTSSSFVLPSSFLKPSFLTNPLTYEQIAINLQFTLNEHTYLNDLVALTYNDRSFALQLVESLSGVELTGKLSYPSGMTANKVNAFDLSWSDVGQRPLLFGALRHWNWVNQRILFQQHTLLLDDVCTSNTPPASLYSFILVISRD